MVIVVRVMRRLFRLIWFVHVKKEITRLTGVVARTILRPLRLHVRLAIVSKGSIQMPIIRQYNRKAGIVITSKANNNLAKHDRMVSLVSDMLRSIRAPARQSPPRQQRHDGLSAE